MSKGTQLRAVGFPEFTNLDPLAADFESSFNKQLHGDEGLFQSHSLRFLKKVPFCQPASKIVSGCLNFSPKSNTFKKVVEPETHSEWVYLMNSRCPSRGEFALREVEGMPAALPRKFQKIDIQLFSGAYRKEEGSPSGLEEFQKEKFKKFQSLLQFLGKSESAKRFVEHSLGNGSDSNTSADEITAVNHFKYKEGIEVLTLLLRWGKTTGFVNLWCIQETLGYSPMSLGPAFFEVGGILNLATNMTLRGSGIKVSPSGKIILKARDSSGISEIDYSWLTTEETAKEGDAWMESIIHRPVQYFRNFPPLSSMYNLQEDRVSFANCYIGSSSSSINSFPRGSYVGLPEWDNHAQYMKGFHLLVKKSENSPFLKSFLKGVLVSDSKHHRDPAVSSAINRDADQVLADWGANTRTNRARPNYREGNVFIFTDPLFRATSSFSRLSAIVSLAEKHSNGPSPYFLPTLSLETLGKMSKRDISRIDIQQQNNPVDKEVFKAMNSVIRCPEWMSKSGLK